MTATLASAPRVDLRQLGAHAGVDLDAALAGLRDLYAYVDARNGSNTADLDLPCQRGCDSCCHESVFITPLELLNVWDFVQRHLDDAARAAIVERGLALYAAHRDLIEAVSEPPPAGEQDHLRLARELRFTCPLLSPDGACRVYPARELYARLFGSSFNAEGGVYGCELVGRHLGGRTVTLLSARAVAQQLEALPLTGRRQVYPYYIQAMYGV